MLEELASRTRKELLLLLLLSAASLSVSTGMFLEGLTALIPSRFDFSSGFLIRICELAVGAYWFGVSLRVLSETSRAQRIMKRPLKKSAAEPISDGEVRTRAFRTIRELMALYRGYYGDIRAVSILSAVIGILKLISLAYLLSSASIQLADSLFEVMFTMCLLIVPSIVYIHSSRSWGWKLHQLEGQEGKLREFLGESFEA